MSIDLLKLDTGVAVKNAKQAIELMFKEEGVRDISFEEIEFDDKSNCWLITIGFIRDTKQYENSFVAGITGRRREYKVVQVNADGGDLISIKNREH